MAGRLTVAASVAVICLASGPKAAAATACAELATLSLPQTTVTAALEVPAGSVVWFGPLLVHKSEPNRSPNERRTLLYSYQPHGFDHSRDIYLRQTT